MNNMPPFFNPYSNNDFINKFETLSQEIKRLERRILDIEKRLMPVPYNKIKPTPLENYSEYMNKSYSTDNYMI